MAASATLVSMGHERKVENLRVFMVNLAKSRGLWLPKTKLFEQKFLDLCLSRTPDHPTYSAMILVAITELDEEGGSCEEAISGFIKSKYKNLPFAHTSLLSHHLAKLVEKREIFCYYNDNNFCYSMSGERKSVASTVTERNRDLMVVRTNDQCAVNEVMSCGNVEESVGLLKSGDQKVDSLQQRSLVEFETSPKRKGCGGINVVEGKSCLVDSTVGTLMIEGVAEEPGPEVVLVNSETKGSIEASIEEGELYEVVVLDEQIDMVMEESGKGEGEMMDISSEQKKAKLCRASNSRKEEFVEVKSKANKTLWECQTEACNNIIALEKMLKQCREKKDVSGMDDASRLPLSMESCKELRRLAHKIECQLSDIIDSAEEAVVPLDESRGCEIEDISEGFVHEGTKKREAPCGDNGSEKTSKQQARNTRIKRDIETTILRKSPRGHKPT